MSGLMKSIEDIWAADATLKAIVPVSRVFTGRVPTTEEYPLPYVSVMRAGGNFWFRSDLATYSRLPISFHVWTDDAALATGESIENAIGNAYANKRWDYDYGTVIDVLDEGHGIVHQPNEPNYKAWEIVKVLTFCLEQERADSTSGQTSGPWFDSGQ